MLRRHLLAGSLAVAATPALAKLRPTYDVKSIKGGRMMEDDWTGIVLSGAPNLCADATAAVQRAHKTRSNIQNN